jgi:3-hydroxyacyl-CoA dehydrogenase
MDIKKVVVIGSGVMGSGIAAQLANANIPVLLLDIPVAEGRNKLATDALERMKKQKPAPLMDPKFADRISIGNTEDDLAKIKDYDWLIEVVIEKLDCSFVQYVFH